MKQTLIGSIAVTNGVDIHDRYDFDESSTPELARLCADIYRANELSCTPTTVLPIPNTDGKSYIVVSHKRID